VHPESLLGAAPPSRIGHKSVSGKRPVPAMVAASLDEYVRNDVFGHILRDVDAPADADGTAPADHESRRRFMWHVLHWAGRFHGEWALRGCHWRVSSCFSGI
jgi:hypothetical protein